MNAEHHRLHQADHEGIPWRKWGAYLSERQWGTVREDYSPHGDAWNYLPHDHARSRAYRWGEDGLGGFSDDENYLCFAWAFWNRRDPILKERFFGLTGPEGNHAEDVKEIYYYLDGTPTHAYLKMLYKYPHARFPYEELLEVSRSRGRHEDEYELIDTGVFDNNRYFDITMEVAKAAPESFVFQASVHNRGSEPASLVVLPQWWFRNTWAWEEGTPRPELRLDREGGLALEHPELGSFRARADGEWLFTDNETNVERLFGADGPGWYKDAFHASIIEGRREALRTDGRGTKAGALHELRLEPGETRCVTAGLFAASEEPPDPGAVLQRGREECEAYYADLQAGVKDEDERRVQRQAFAGLVWSKQFYSYDVKIWLEGDPAQPPPPPERRQGRNHKWGHLNNDDIILMPDTWEYPWYAAWDLAFHCIPYALLDAEYTKQQLLLFTREWYMHPDGQLPAYEWALGDVNPPVHAWAAYRVYKIDQRNSGKADLEFLERIFQKLLLNFTWWVNRKDRDFNNIFQGGFLGLDNIGIFDRSATLPTGGHLEQADGTSWMAMYCLNMLRIALELAPHKKVYEDMATKFFEHFLYIADAMMDFGGLGEGLWDEEDGFYYDALHFPDGRREWLKIRSMVGLIPLFAVETIEPDTLDQLPEFRRHLQWFLDYRPDLARLVSRWHEPGLGERRLLSLVRGSRMKKLLQRMLDEAEFLSPYGVRALSKVHETEPYTLHVDGQEMKVSYEPGESQTGVFGGNSNWRGPVWFPVNFLLIESLRKFHHYYGDEFKVECPTGSGNFVTLLEASNEVSRRLCRIFLRDEHGRRPVYGRCEKLAGDPAFNDHVMFYEYFHGDRGWGLGAEHQTGWTALVAKLLRPPRKQD